MTLTRLRGQKPFYRCDACPQERAALTDYVRLEFAADHRSPVVWCVRHARDLGRMMEELLGRESRAS